MTTNERRFQVNVHYKVEVNENGVIAGGMNGTTTATAQEAAQWIIGFAKENSEYTITEFSIRDCATYKKYNSNDADIQALNSKPEVVTEETVGNKMAQVTTKMAKNGTKLYYVDGKRVSKAAAMEIAANNDREIMSNLFEQATGDAEVVTTVEVKTEVNETILDNYYFNNVETAIAAAEKILATFGDRVQTIRVGSTGDWAKGKLYAYNDHGTMKLTAAGNAEIEAVNAEPALTDNMKTAAEIVESLGNLLVKFDHRGEGKNGGLAIHYETFSDEHAEFPTSLRIVEVFTDMNSYILHHVNVITGYGDDKQVTQYFFNVEYQPQTSWENPHNYETTGDLSDRNLNGRIIAFYADTSKPADKLSELKDRALAARRAFSRALDNYYVNYKGEFYTAGDAGYSTTESEQQLYVKENGEYREATKGETNALVRLELKADFANDAVDAEIARIAATVVKFEVGKYYASDESDWHGQPCNTPYLILKRTKKFVTIYAPEQDDWGYIENYDPNDEIDGEFDCIFRKKIQFDERGEYVEWEAEDGELVTLLAKNETTPPEGEDAQSEDSESDDAQSEDNVEEDMPEITIGDDTVTFFFGEFHSVFSAKYHAAIVRDLTGCIHYCVYGDGDTEIYNVSEHEVSYDSFIETLTKRGNREKLLALRKDYSIIDRLSANNSSLWYVNGKKSSQVKVWNIVQSYGLTLEEYLAENNAYINERVAASCAQIAIEEQAKFLKMKITRDAQPSGDNIWNLIPRVGELNDVEPFNSEPQPFNDNPCLDANDTLNPAEPSNPPVQPCNVADSIMSAMAIAYPFIKGQNVIENVTTENFINAANSDGLNLNIFMENGEHKAVSVTKGDEKLAVIKIEPKPRIESPKQLRDSLERAMKVALENRRAARRNRNLALENYEYELYTICKNALKEVA